MKDDLERGFDALLADTNRQQRGYRFETWLRKLLFSAGFTVRANPQAAKPRQSDIYAQFAGQDFLIEAKWRTAKVDVSHIDALRSRLGRTAGDVVGCLFCLSDYAPTAIAAVEERRTREIILFDAAEIQNLARYPSSLAQITEEKRESLRIHGSVKFVHRDSDRLPPSETQLPASEFALCMGDRVISSVACMTDNVDIVFSQAHLDPIGNTGDSEFALRLDLDIRTLSEVREVMGTLHNYLDLSGSGSFAIHQTRMSWHGVGAENFLASAGAWQSRYQQSSLQEVHHSETLNYFDQFSYGCLLLTARQRVGDNAFLHGAEVEIRLAGIPLDREPLLQVCKKTGNRGAFLTLEGEKLYDLEPFRHRRTMIEPMGLILSSRLPEGIVCGIVAKNPFFGKSMASKTRLKPNSPVENLNTAEILCCSLRDWHDFGDVIDEYFLTSIAAKWIGGTVLLRPICTWNAITKSAQQ